MATPAQQSSPAPALRMLVKKQTSSPSVTSFLPLIIASPNTTLKKSVENTQTGKNVNNKFSLENSSNRNGEHLTDFTLENRLTRLSTKYQKRKGKLEIYTYANNTKAKIDYILINKKWNSYWIVKHIPLLKVRSPLTKLSLYYVSIYIYIKLGTSIYIYIYIYILVPSFMCFGHFPIVRGRYSS